MRTRYPTAICLVLWFLANAHAQTGNGGPALPPVPKTGPPVDARTSTHFVFKGRSLISELPKREQRRKRSD